MVVPPFWQAKYKREAAKNWDRFYKRNENRFFKDRHWLQREFPELALLDCTQSLLEVGCGVGNLALPVSQITSCRLVAVDFSPTAIGILKAEDRFDADRMTAVVHDFVGGPLPGVRCDMATMVFVLSAVPPESQVAFLRNVAQSAPLVLFRDYAVEDAAQKRFSEDSKMSDVLFVRQDGTLAYYFDLAHLEAVARDAGLEVVDPQYKLSETVNMKENLHVERRFLQCKLRKTAAE